MVKENLKRVMYTKGPNDGDFSGHGLSFEKGVVYTVSNDVFEWVKAFSGFVEVREIKLSVVDFPKIKKVRK